VEAKRLSGGKVQEIVQTGVKFLKVSFSSLVNLSYSIRSPHRCADPHLSLAPCSSVFQDDLTLLTTLYKTHKSLPPKSSAKISSLYILDSLCRGVYKLKDKDKNKDGDGKTAGLARGFLSKVEGILEGWARDMCEGWSEGTSSLLVLVFRPDWRNRADYTLFYSCHLVLPCHRFSILVKKHNTPPQCGSPSTTHQHPVTTLLDSSKPTGKDDQDPRYMDQIPDLFSGSISPGPGDHRSDRSYWNIKYGSDGNINRSKWRERRYAIDYATGKSSECEDGREFEWGCGDGWAGCWSYKGNR
jgi:hypothetical protein